MELIANPRWMRAHKDARDVWDSIMGDDRRCPYCGHRQDRHYIATKGLVFGFRVNNPQIEVTCDDCSLTPNDRRCIILN